LAESAERARAKSFLAANGRLGAGARGAGGGLAHDEQQQQQEEEEEEEVEEEAASSFPVSYKHARGGAGAAGSGAGAVHGRKTVTFERGSGGGGSHRTGRQQQQPVKKQHRKASSGGAAAAQSSADKKQRQHHAKEAAVTAERRRADLVQSQRHWPLVYQLVRMSSNEYAGLDDGVEMARHALSILSQGLASVEAPLTCVPSDVAAAIVSRGWLSHHDVKLRQLSMLVLVGLAPANFKTLVAGGLLGDLVEATKLVIGLEHDTVEAKLENSAATGSDSCGLDEEDVDAILADVNMRHTLELEKMVWLGAQGGGQHVQVRSHTEQDKIYRKAGQYKKATVFKVARHLGAI
jgi:hypothetical protein